MSLSTREQQALDSIKDDLASCDPALVVRLSIFIRLASGEEMPAGEKIHVGSRRAVRRSRPEPRRTRRGYQRLGLQQAVLLLWLVTTIALIAITLACNRDGSQGTCTGSWATICTGATSAPKSVRAFPEYCPCSRCRLGGAEAGAPPTGRRAGVTLASAWNTDSDSTYVKPRSASEPDGRSSRNSRRPPRCPDPSAPASATR